MVKSKVSNLLHGKNSLEQTLTISASEETFNLLKVIIQKYFNNLMYIF